MRSILCSEFFRQQRTRLIWGSKGGLTITQNTHSNEEVLEFYRELPFNIRETVDASATAITSKNSFAVYPGVGNLIQPESRVLDAGCGTGWLSNTISYHYKCSVTGIDFNPVAIKRAQAVAKKLNLLIDFSEQDIFLYEPLKRFELVVSIGVLHHTNDCREGLLHLASRCVAQGGHIFVGLYHSYGRAPFLNHFKQLRNNGSSEADLFKEYQRLHSQITDETLLYSWFRDQVLHPHETQHDLAMVCDAFDEAGIKLVSTSINRFGPLGSRVSLFEQEKEYEKIGQDALVQGRYFPGFFVALGCKL
jgi:2-polyprenyl-3-methyl-5-hydroxy-6-metoxy-1,4-benzoquinol methylase